MRTRPASLNPSAIHVLRLLHDSDLILTPTVIQRNTTLGKKTVSTALEDLTDAGLVTKIERGHYRTTQKGRAYIRGELDAGEIENVE